ncbi:MAG TPA: hypothetical protein VFY66_06605 [Anaerolineales bacterium]|nr:hypothetical protein [Anaerolineales bacterium]
MKKKRLLILLAGVAALILAFVFLNFHVAVSNTQSDKNITTTSIGNQLPDPIQRKDKISIAVVGESPLVSALRKALPEEMHRAGLENIEVVPSLEPAYQNPALVIQVEKPKVLWTPFFAISGFSVQAGYASSGDTTFMGETPVTMDNKNGPSLNMYAEFKVTDRSWGLISRLGYHQLLADYLARHIAAALKDIYYGA